MDFCVITVRFNSVTLLWRKWTRGYLLPVLLTQLYFCDSLYHPGRRTNCRSSRRLWRWWAMTDVLTPGEAKYDQSMSPCQPCGPLTSASSWTLQQSEFSRGQTSSSTLRLQCTYREKSNSNRGSANMRSDWFCTCFMQGRLKVPPP
jgi:hypothetical protein